jgi:predicted nucleotidyltransferase
MEDGGHASLSQIASGKRGTPRMISPELIDLAAQKLLDAIPPGSRGMLFGSQARVNATDQSDADFLVIEPVLNDRHAEMVRLRQVLRPLRIPVDILVVSRTVFEEWKDTPSTILFDAAREGREYGVAA